MARCDLWYSDKMSGREDMGIKRILSRGDKDSESSRLRSIMLYYFKGADIADISERLGISQQAVYAAMSRAKKTIYGILKYYI